MARMKFPRLAARALILSEDRLLLVNAYPGERSDLWCAPGGGVVAGADLHENLRREVHEETGLDIGVGALAAVSEFHNPADGYHQIDLFFRATIRSGRLSDTWQDPEQVVNRRRFFTMEEMAAIRFKPDSLPQMAFGPEGPALYDPMEPIVE